MISIIQGTLLWNVLCWCCHVASGTEVDAAPVLAYSVREELPPSTFVGNVRTDSGLSDRYEPEIFATLRFSFYQSNSLSDHFALDSVTGRLLTTVKIDREQLCQGGRTTVGCEVIALDIKVTPYQYFEIIKVKVTIEDDNDNAPTFSSSPVEWIVSESASVGTEFSLPHALDADSGENGVQSYDLVTTNGLFALKQINQSYGLLEANLILIGRLDREYETSHKLQINAKDGGYPARRGTLWVYVSVTDTNDNSAAFTRDVYVANVTEGT